MIRVRDIKGKIVRQNDDDMFIELCDARGDIVAVFFEHQENGEIRQIMTDAAEARKYEELFKVKFVDKHIKLEE
jgi:hypothetical protein